MGKRSRQKRAKQKLLQQQKYLSNTSPENRFSEADETIVMREPEGSPEYPKKRVLSLAGLSNKRLSTQGKKISTYIITCLIIFLGLFGLYKLATRPLPGNLVADLGNEHIPSAISPHSPYNSKPPTSGPHLDPKADWGIHDQQIQDELQLHNLEDGGVLIQYDCDGQDCTDLVEKLKKIAKKYKDKVILAPYADLDQKIAITAWNRIDTFSEFDEKRITTFINSYRGIDHHKK